MKSLPVLPLNKSRNAIVGSIVHSVNFGELQIIESGLIVFSQSGVIEEVVDLSQTPKTQEYLASFGSLLDFTGKLIIPGFVDAHCHAPQYVFAGTGMDLPLLAWLEKYTFPCEALYSDTDFARMAYTKSIQRHLKCGTTFASYFATIHNEAGKVLVDVIHSVGQRAFVGKVSMDRNCPDFYKEDTTVGCDDAEEFVQYVLSQTATGKEFLRSVGSVAVVGEEPLMVKRHIEESVLASKKVRAVSIVDGVTCGVEVSEGHEGGFFSGPLNAEDFQWVGSEYSGAASTAAVGLVTPCTSPKAVTHRRALALSSPSTTLAFRYPPAGLLNQPTTPLVMPVITPRFVPTCTPAMMQCLAMLGAKYRLPVQSHLSESEAEIEWVRALHPDCPSYTAVYQKYGLLHANAYMAHCCHCTPDEIALLAETGCGVVHCANSNFMLNSGVMDVRVFLNGGVRVALGTDVAGGYSPSMLDALRQCIVASRVKFFDHRKDEKEKQQLQQLKVTMTAVSSASDSDTKSDCDCTSNSTSSTSSTTAEPSVQDAQQDKLPYRALNYAEAFHLATVGGAEVLGMGKVVGNFLVGKKLDCLVVDVNCHDSPIDTFEGEGVQDHFEKFLFNGDDRNIVHVFVDGRQVI